VLFSLALLSLTIAAVSRNSINADAGRRQAEVSDALVQQVEVIRSKILACGLTYPAGNNGLGYRLAFPAVPSSALVADLQCPGAPTGQKELWAGQDGIYAPQVPMGLSAWQFQHDAASMRISIQIASSTPYLTAGMKAAARRLGPQALLSQNASAAPVLTVKLAG
jgi:hypothetical protein